MYHFQNIALPLICLLLLQDRVNAQGSTVAAVASLQASSLNPAVTAAGRRFPQPSAGSLTGVGGTQTPLSRGLAGTIYDRLSKSRATSIHTSSVDLSVAARTYTLNGIIFTGGPSGLAAESATITPAGPPVTLSSHVFSLEAAGSSVKVDGNLSPLLDAVPITGPVSDSTSTAIPPSVTVSATSTYTLAGVILFGDPRSGLTVKGSTAIQGRQSGSNPSSRLAAGDATISPGGLPAVVSGHTFSLPTPATGSNIFVDGTLTHLSTPTPTTSNIDSSRSSRSDVPDLTHPPAPKPTGTQTQDNSISGLGEHDDQSTSVDIPGLHGTTSTDTVQPTDASTEAITNTAFSTNHWLTTERAGQTTVVPVIVGCPTCGGIGGGLILWNFPPIPKVSFQFPKLGLPPISFPCIPIPLIKECNSPPTSGSSSGSSGKSNDPDDSDDSDDSDDPNDPDDPSPSEPKPSKTQATETDGKSSAQSSTTPSSTGSSTGTSSSLSSTSSVSSNAACALKSYTFSLPPGTDSTTLTTPTGTESTSSGSSNAACALKPYTFSLPPGIDSTTLTTPTETDAITNSASSSTISSSNAACALKSYTFSLPPGTDSTTLTTPSGSDIPPSSLPGTTTGSASSSASSDSSGSPFSLTSKSNVLPAGTDSPTLTSVADTDVPTDTNSVTTTSQTSSQPTISTSVSAIKTTSPVPTSAAPAPSVTTVMSVPAAGVVPTAPKFDPDKTTLACGEKYATDTEVTFTSIPRVQTNKIMENAAKFCTPSKNGKGQTLVLKKGKDYTKTHRFDAPGRKLYNFDITWDPRPECADIEAPFIRDSVPTGPAYWCYQYFDALTNKCDAEPDQDKNGGRLYASCVIYSWEAADGCTGNRAPKHGC